MKNSSLMIFGMSAAALCSSTGFAWYGPICYPDHVAHVTLTLQSLVGEAPGEIKVSFDNNGGIVELESIKASKTVPGAHEIILKRNAESENGIVGVIATSPRSAVGLKFELEFRKNPSDCTGAILKVSASGERAKESAVKNHEHHSSVPKMVLTKENKGKVSAPAAAPTAATVEAAEATAPAVANPTAPSASPSSAPAASEVTPASQPAPSAVSKDSTQNDSAPSSVPSKEAAPQTPEATSPAPSVQ